MRITIQGDLCCGAQRCTAVAPDVYRLDALGYNASDGDVVAPGREAEATRGMRACPEGAIALIADEQDEGRGDHDARRL